jgi:hypothetical protein
MHWFTLRCVRSLFLKTAFIAVVACGMLGASTVTYSSYANCSDSLLYLGYSTQCDTFEFAQFNPNLGTLVSVSYTFVDDQEIYDNFDSQNDNSGPDFGITDLAYSYTVTGSTSDPFTGAPLTASETNSGTVGIDTPICMCISEDRLTFQSSGNISNLTGFILGTTPPLSARFVAGGGYLGMYASPGYSQGGYYNSSPLVFDSYDDLQDNEALTLTYTYTPAPEPSGGIAFLAVTLLLVLWLRSRSRTRIKIA